MNKNTIYCRLLENNYKLLGQINVSQEEYEILICDLRRKVNDLREKMRNCFVQIIAKPDLMFSLALVHIAIRHYNEKGFWNCFTDEVGVKIFGSETTNLGKIFYKTIKSFKLFCPQHDEGNFQYVEYIKAHAFVPNSYLKNFFDFSYAFFENNLFRQISGNVEQDLNDLARFMRSTLKNKTDTIPSEADCKKIIKSYRLLKSTRTVFAQCDVKTVNSIFYPVLELIDKYFYQDEITSLPKDRFQEGFAQWCENQIKNDDIKNKQSKTRVPYSHKPFIQVDVDREHSYIIIPAQKLRKDTCNGFAEVEITINDCITIQKLDLYESFGTYISEEIKFPISDIFASIDVKIKTLSEKTYNIASSDYRIFKEAWENIVRLEKGHNYILTKQHVQIRLKNENDLLDKRVDYTKWKYFSITINEDSVFYIGNKPLSIIGEFSIEPIFERPIKYFLVSTENRRKLEATESHPTVGFIVEKSKVNGSVLLINDNKYKIEDIKEKDCYDLPFDDSKMAISVRLDFLLERNDRYYNIKLDVPGESHQLLCEYLLLNEFKCNFDQARYTYHSEAKLEINTGGHNLKILDSTWQLDYASKKKARYIIPLENANDEIELCVYIDNNYYRITMPLKVFRYGFSKSAMRTQKEEYIWYTDLKRYLYVKIPGAVSASAYLGNDINNKSCGVQIEPEVFRIDISEFTNVIRENIALNYYINIEYVDNAIRHLSLPIILRTVLIKPYFKIFIDNDKPYTNLKITGNANVFLNVKDESGQVVIDKKQISSGYTQLPELEKNKVYNFYPFMEESDEFGLYITPTQLKSLKDVEVIDFNDLTNCWLPITKVIFEGNSIKLNYDYFIFLYKREGNSKYLGNMYSFKINNNKSKTVEKKNKIFIGKTQVFPVYTNCKLNVIIQHYSYQDKARIDLYYDKKECKIIHPDDNILDRNSLYDRFSLLDGDTTVYVIDTNRIKK